MCGIAGVLGCPETEMIRTLTEALVHRGPDSIGFYSRDGLHLGMTRLSIIDLDHGNQPIFNENGDKVIVFNGEIYNYRELRRELMAAGHVFTTDSDTEVVLHLYEEYGASCVDHLRGMFAFAIADGDRIYLARDRIGIKPVFYSFLPARGLFLFASEAKALLRCPAVDGGLDMETFAELLVLGYSTGRRTLFRGIEEVEPGEYIIAERTPEGCSLTRHCYYRLALRPEPGFSLPAAEAELTELLNSAVETHLMADVEVGVTLSGGLDSSFLALLMDERTQGRAFAFTTAYPEQHPDLLHAKAICRSTKFQHEISIPAFDEFVANVPGCILAEERPASLTGMPFFMLCQLIGGKVKVCLNGEGADELFGGYDIHAAPHFFLRAVKRRLPFLKRLGIAPSERVVEIVRSLARSTSYEEYLASAFEVNLREQLVQHHLEVADRYAMASSLEIRVPYLDHRLVEFVNRLPLSYKVHNREGSAGRKYILKRVALSAFGQRIEDVVGRLKLGFPSAGASHLQRFDRLCERLLPVDYLSKHEFGFCFFRKRELFIFEIFQQIFLENRGQLDAGFNVMEFLKARAT